MKRKTSVLLAAMIAVCMGTTSCDVFTLGKDYEPKEFLGAEDLGGRAQMPDPYFTWTYSRVLIDRMKDASELNLKREVYIDAREYMEGGEITKTVTELKTVLYSDYVLETTYIIDGAVMEVETISLVEQDGEKKRLEQLKDANGNVTYEHAWSWNEYKEADYYQYLIENSKINWYLGSNYYSWSYYKKNDIYSSYATETRQVFSELRDANNEEVVYYQEEECLIQLKINDSVDRFEKKYIHVVNRIKQDYEGYIIDPYVYSEVITEFTAVYETKKPYNK